MVHRLQTFWLQKNKQHLTVFAPTCCSLLCTKQLQKQKKLGGKEVAETAPATFSLSRTTKTVETLHVFLPFRPRNSPIIIISAGWNSFGPSSKSWGRVTTRDFREVKPNRTENHAPNVSLYGPVFTFLLIWGETHT